MLPGRRPRIEEVEPFRLLAAPVRGVRGTNSGKAEPWLVDPNRLFAATDVEPDHRPPATA
jgi:hypothetical protein